MAIVNPVYVVVVPFLFLFTIPLAVFAGITTTVAFTVLIFRVVLVYLELVMTLLPSYLTFRRGRHPVYQYGPASLPKTPSSLSASSAGRLSRSPSPVFKESARTLSSTRLHRRTRTRSRRPSSTSAASRGGSATPLFNENGSIGLVPSVGIDRDFEGVGGWRFGSIDDDESWTAINSRLERPDRQHYGGGGAGGGGGRHHYRSHSGGMEGGFLMMKGRSSTRSGSPETVVHLGGSSRMSPNSSRVRTPGGSVAVVMTAADEGDYFPVVAPSRKKVAVA